MMRIEKKFDIALCANEDGILKVAKCFFYSLFFYSLFFTEVIQTLHFYNKNKPNTLFLFLVLTNKDLDIHKVHNIYFVCCKQTSFQSLVLNRIIQRFNFTKEM